MGRRTTFTPKIGAKICDLLAEGHSLLAISKMDGMKPITTLQGWAWNADWSSEAFVVNYARARFRRTVSLTISRKSRAN